LNYSFVFQEVVHRTAVSVPDRDVWRLYATSTGQVDNFRIRQENHTMASLLSSNTKVADVFDRQEVFGVIAADLLENPAPN